MKLETERANWKHNEQGINKFVTDMVEHLRDQAEAEPVAYMAVDMAFRSYMQWLHSAQISRQDPAMVRNSTLHLINVIILELTSRMGAVDETGNRIPLTQWVEEFVADLCDELSEDIETLVQQRAGTSGTA